MAWHAPHGPMQPFQVQPFLKALLPLSPTALQPFPTAVQQLPTALQPFPSTPVP